MKLELKISIKYIFLSIIILLLFSCTPKKNISLIKRFEVISNQLSLFQSDTNKLLLDDGTLLLNTRYISKIESLMNGHKSSNYIAISTSELVKSIDVEHFNKIRNLVKSNSITDFDTLTNLKNSDFPSNIERLQISDNREIEIKRVYDYDKIDFINFTLCNWGIPNDSFLYSRDVFLWSKDKFLLRGGVNYLLTYDKEINGITNVTEFHSNVSNLFFHLSNNYVIGLKISDLSDGDNVIWNPVIFNIEDDSIFIVLDYINILGDVFRYNTDSHFLLSNNKKYVAFFHQPDTLNLDTNGVNCIISIFQLNGF